MRAGWSAGSTLAMLLLALLAGGGSGCGALAPSSGSGSCRISAENPHQSSGSSAFIVGKARIRCDIAVDSAVLKVRIERLVNRKWTLFAENAGDGQPYSPVVPDRKYTSQATNLCRSGTFRTAARGWGILNGVRSDSAEWTYSRTVTDPCA